MIALWILAVVWISTALRTRIGEARWRSLHRLAVFAWLAALAHGLMAGTDSGSPWAVFAYTASGVTVVVLLGARIVRDERVARGASSAPRAVR